MQAQTGFICRPSTARFASKIKVATVSAASPCIVGATWL